MSDFAIFMEPEEYDRLRVEVENLRRIVQDKSEAMTWVGRTWLLEQEKARNELRNIARSLQDELHYHFGCDELCEKRFPEAHKEGLPHG